MKTLGLTYRPMNTLPTQLEGCDARGQIARA